MVESIDAGQVRDMLLQVADAIIAAEAVLTDADRALGDGDHGLGMQRGMEAVKEALDAASFTTVDEPLVAMGKAMVSSMGGASGAIFGTMFRSAGKTLKGAAVLDAAGVAGMLEAAVADIQTRGGAKPGDKTMLDALVPAAQKVREMSGAPLGEAMSAAAAAAEAGKEASCDMIATMGRAKTLGERSLGKPDAGAISVSIIFATMRDYLKAIG